MTDFSPHVTVATVIPNADNTQFLMVEEYNEHGQAVLNQPAGHLEANETLIEAAIRETLEETGWHIEVTGFLGVALFTAPNGITYVRNTFVAKALAPAADSPLDDGIIGPVWLSPQQLQQRQADWRSELTYTTVERFLNGPTFPLSALYG